METPSKRRLYLDCVLTDPLHAADRFKLASSKLWVWVREGLVDENEFEDILKMICDAGR